MRNVLLVLSLVASCGSDPDFSFIEHVDDPIVGGASYGYLPSIGALFYDGQPHCTGTLVGPRRVLTAAHCVVGFSTGRLEFRIGKNALAPTASYRVSSKRAHPDYDPETLLHDIATVTLRATPSLEPLKLLGAMDESWVGEELFFVGYGVTDGEGQTGAGRKRAVWMPIIEVGATQFAYADEAKNTCQGDSGGPALHRTGRGRYVVAGVTSYGDVGCHLYGVDTRVDVYREFVLP